MLASPKPIPFFSSSPAPIPAKALSAAQVPTNPSQSGEPTFHELFGGSPVAMWIFDITSGEFLDANAAAVKQYGWSREEFLAMTAELVRPPEDFAHFRDYREQMESIAASNLGTTDMWLHTRKDGTRLWAETTWQLISYRGRKAALETVMDRSAYVRTEEENRELAHALNLAADAIIVCNLDREVLFWNRGAERTYGWTDEEAVGRSVKELLNIDPDTALKSVNELMEKRQWSGQMTHSRKDGNAVIVDSRWTLAIDESTRKPTSILIVNSDITETKKLESRFLRSQRLESIGALASGVAHDLNNILSPIMMAVGILRESLGKNEQKMLGIIEASAARGAGIVKQVLTFARGADGEHALLHPKNLASEMTKVMQQTFPKNINIQTQFPGELWLINGDATQLHQVLLNLCVNARDAIGENGGKLRVAIENVEVDECLAEANPGATVGSHVCFSVADSGSGMPPEVMKKIFDPFFTTKEQGKGTGLGLATVISIIKAHKGFLTIQSQVGVGTTFKVFIPANPEAKQEAEAEASPESLRGNGELVLVVDDESTIREAVVRTLTEHNYRCYTAEDGTDALALYFERREIDVVITDLHMGMMDGITLIRSLQKMNSGIKAIISSGHIDKERHATLSALGITSILEKPYTSEKLLKTVRDIINSSAAKTA